MQPLSHPLPHSREVQQRSPSAVTLNSRQLTALTRPCESEKPASASAGPSLRQPRQESPASLATASAPWRPPGPNGPGSSSEFITIRRLLGAVTGVPGADLEGRFVRPARRAARTVRLRLVAAAPGDDDQEVLVNPGDLGAGQAGQERRDGRAQFIRGVERERRVVVALGLGPEPPGRARARMPEGLRCDHREPVGSPDGVPELRPRCAGAAHAR